MAVPNDKMKKATYPELKDFYTLGKTIGSGGFAKVKLAIHILTGEQVAIKIMDKKVLKDDLPRVNQEIGALKMLSHSHICKLYQVLETQTHFFLVMEYCSGGELFDHIVEKERLEEEESREFFRQIVRAVAYCHHLGFVHRDLKPENILLDNQQNLKIVDFGLCVRPSNGEQLYTSCGSPNYAAPELIKGEKYQGSKVDIWSLGVLLYTLLCGTLPFEDMSTDKLYRKILRGSYEEPIFLSNGAKELLRAMLEVDPIKRIDTPELCSHPWVIQGLRAPINGPNEAQDILPRDEDCLSVIAQYRYSSPDRVWAELKTNTYDYTMATYRILLNQKSRSIGLRVLRKPLYSVVSHDRVQSESSSDSLSGTTFVVNNYCKNIVCKDAAQTNQAMERSVRRENIGRRQGTLNGKRTRIRSPGLDDKEHVPRKLIATSNLSPLAVKDENSTCAQTPSECRRRTPGSARKMIERGLRLMLTPKRSLTPQPQQPAVLVGRQLSNVTGTSSNNPDAVLASLNKALNEKGIICSQKGYTLKGKMKAPWVSDERLCKVSFELEVCWVPLAGRRQSTSGEGRKEGVVVGIRRKRLKGDAWIYKTICEEVLAVAAAS